jgi:hypothetical protein
MFSIWNGDAPTGTGSTTLSVAEYEPLLWEVSSICFHSHDSAPALSCARHRSRLPYGQWGPQISRKPSVLRAFFVEPQVPIWSMDLAYVTSVSGS